MKEIKKIKVFVDAKRKYNDSTKARKEFAKEAFVKEEISEYETFFDFMFIDSRNHIIEYRDSKKWKTWLSGNVFSDGEMDFFKTNYGIKIEVDSRFNKSVIKATNRHIHPLYGYHSELILIEENQKEYLIIKFKRWENESQPRGAGEDMRGENVHYIHGIWENPLITDEIIEKIKT